LVVTSITLIAVPVNTSKPQHPLPVQTTGYDKVLKKEYEVKRKTGFGISAGG
jgi:hypothetical protein